MTSKGFPSKIGTVLTLAVLTTSSAKLRARNGRKLTFSNWNPDELATSERSGSSILGAGNDDSKVDLGVELPPDIEGLLPSKSEVADLYGPKPIVYGLDTCETFRNTVAPEDRFLAVAGLFNTGTHLVSQLLGQNCALPESEKRGEKHSIPGHDLEDGMLFSVFWHKHAPVSYRSHMVRKGFEAFSDFIRFNQMPIVMMKDPLFWMSSMCKKPNCIDSLRKQLRQDEYCPRLVDDDNEPIPATGDYRVFPNATAEFATFEYESLLDMWQSYYKEYKGYEQPRLIVRYEDLIFHGETVIEQICTCAGGTMKDEYSPVSGFAKKGVQSRFDDSNKYLAHAASFYGSKSERENVLKTKKDEEFARQALDADLLAEFHYQTPSMADSHEQIKTPDDESSGLVIVVANQPKAGTGTIVKSIRESLQCVKYGHVDPVVVRFDCPDHSTVFQTHSASRGAVESLTDFRNGQSNLYEDVLSNNGVKPLHPGQHVNAGKCLVITAVRNPLKLLPSWFAENHRSTLINGGINVQNTEQVYRDYLKELPKRDIKLFQDTLYLLQEFGATNMTEELERQDAEGGHTYLENPKPDGPWGGCKLLFLRLEAVETWRETFTSAIGHPVEMQYTSTLGSHQNALETMKIIKNTSTFASEISAIAQSKPVFREVLNYYESLEDSSKQGGHQDPYSLKHL